FVYMIGLEAGETFFQEIRKQLGLMLASVIAITAGAAAAVGLGELLGLLRGTAVGVFAGSLTSTPSLALAQEMTDPDNPAVGYSIGYPVGVTLAIVMVAVFINREWKARNDQLDPDDVELEQATVYVDREISAEQMRDIAGQQVRFVAMRRNRRWHVLDMERALEPGDRVRIFASRAALSEAIERLGSRMRHRRLTDPYLTVHRFTVSNRDIAGLTVGSLPLYRRFEARVTVIRRADDEILATPDTYLEMGDVVEVALPTSRV
ncbi:TrkA C-terminal domain-containing protein, partial [Actinotignum timonense]